MTQLLREYLAGNAFTTVLNDDNYGTVTLFRAYPDGVETPDIKEQEMTNPTFRNALLRHNDYNIVLRNMSTRKQWQVGV